MSLKIAENENQLIDSLFKTGGTFDGFIRKIGKRYIDIFVLGNEYRVNKYGVFCKKTLLDTGKTWFSYSDLDMSMREENDFCEKYALDYEYKNHERVYRFK